MFHTNRLIRVAAAGLISVSALLAGAANAELPPNGKKGGSLTVLSNSAINSLNPAIQSGVATAVPGSQLFASLLLVDDKWQFHPYLADSWEKSEDGKTYTLGSQSVTPASGETGFKRHVFSTVVRLNNISGRRETP